MPDTPETTEQSKDRVDSSSTQTWSSICQHLYAPAEQKTASTLSATAQAAFAEADSIFQHATNVRYEHNHTTADKQVLTHGNSLTADTDCSGFISHVLFDTAPKQYEAIEKALHNFPIKNYPKAADFENFFESLNSQQKDGWENVSSVDQLQRGDIIAWSKPDNLGNTGHVAMVMDPPTLDKTEIIGNQNVRVMNLHVIDSSSDVHFAPEQLPPNAHQSQRDGLGEGYVQVYVAADGKPIGFQEGTYWNEGHHAISGPTFSNKISMGRLV